jgi:DNA-binding transcriptional ArsR family regulator
MVNNNLQLDQVFKALADPTRRAIIERLTRGPRSTKELAEPFEMALPSFVQHLNLLEECQLVSSHKEGRVRTYTLNAKELKKAETWMMRQRDLWEKRLQRLDTYLSTMKEDDDD